MSYQQKFPSPQNKARIIISRKDDPSLKIIGNLLNNLQEKESNKTLNKGNQAKDMSFTSVASPVKDSTSKDSKEVNSGSKFTVSKFLSQNKLKNENQGYNPSSVYNPFAKNFDQIIHKKSYMKEDFLATPNSQYFSVTEGNANNRIFYKTFHYNEWNNPVVTQDMMKKENLYIAKRKLISKSNKWPRNPQPNFATEYGVMPIEAKSFVFPLFGESRKQSETSSTSTSSNSNQIKLNSKLKTSPREFNKFDKIADNQYFDNRFTDPEEFLSLRPKTSAGIKTSSEQENSIITLKLDTPKATIPFKSNERALSAKQENRKVLTKPVTIFTEKVKLTELKEKLLHENTQKSSMIDDRETREKILFDNDFEMEEYVSDDEDNDEVFNTTIQRKTLLLQSIYEGRPPTIFFQYPICCGKSRDISRTLAVTPEQEKAYELKYKSGRYFCVIQTFETAGFKISNSNGWNFLWGKPKYDRIKDMNKFQKTNHFPGCWQLGRKDNLWRNVSRLKRQFQNDYDFMPNTYLLSSDYERFNQVRENAESKSLWIMKPCASACGRGIQLINKKSKIKKSPNYLISDYIANPHLIHGKKYDLRLYVLVSSYDPLRIYLHKEGLVRFATSEYNTNSKNLKERFIHLTNWSVNKHSENYVSNDLDQDEKSSKWSFETLRKYYENNGINFGEVMSKIEDVVIKTIISAEPYMLNSLNRSADHRNNCFELYGFDVLIDSNIKPWLMEVNVCPSLNASSELDKQVKTIVMCDIMNLIGFFPYDKKKYEEELRKKVPGTETKKYGSKNINDIMDLNYENCLEKLAVEDWNILFETDEEWNRIGDFKRLFPRKDNYQNYSKFFEFERYNNKIVWLWLKAEKNFLEKISQKLSNFSV